jgi:hypothetical protein
LGEEAAVALVGDARQKPKVEPKDEPKEAKGK